MTEKSAADRVLELDENATEGPWTADTIGGFLSRGGDIICQFWDRHEDDFVNERFNMRLISEYRTLAPTLARQVKALEERYRVDVVGAWRGEELFWQFKLGRLRHEISDRDLKSWLHNESGLERHNLPHDGCIRGIHTNAYIEKEIFNSEAVKA